MKIKINLLLIQLPTMLKLYIKKTILIILYMNRATFRIDNLQYCNWSKEIFQINREAKLDAIHVTIAYHEDFDEVKKNVEIWNKHFKNYKDLIVHGKTFKDIEKAHREKKTAIFFGFQNCSPIEDDIGLVEEVHKMGIRFMQLTYNNQSLLATGCYEEKDSGVTRMGKEVIKEMNRLGVVVDMSHSAEKSTLDAIKYLLNLLQLRMLIHHFGLLQKEINQMKF